MNLPRDICLTGGGMRLTWHQNMKNSQPAGQLSVTECHRGLWGRQSGKQHQLMIKAGHPFATETTGYQRISVIFLASGYSWSRESRFFLSHTKCWKNLKFTGNWKSGRWIILYEELKARHEDWRPSSSCVWCFTTDIWSNSMFKNSNKTCEIWCQQIFVRLSLTFIVEYYSKQQELW